MAMSFDTANLLQMGKTLWGWIYWAILIGGFGLLSYGIAFWFNKKKRYEWIVRIFNKDATGQVIQQPDDKGGIFLDKKTQYRLFMLRKNKFALDPDDIPYILTSKGKKIVYLLQTGLKNFQYMKPEISNNPGLVFNVQDEDVAWAINAWERYKNPYKNKFMEQIMPFLGMAFVFLIVVAALYFMIVKAGFNAELLTQLSESAKDIAASLAKASIGGTIVE